MPRLLEGHARPITQNLISNIIFEIGRVGGSPLLGWIAKHYSEVFLGVSTGWAIAIWVIVAACFALLITLIKRKWIGDTDAAPLALSAAQTAHIAPPLPTHITISPTISPVFNNSPQIDQRPINYQTQEQSQQQRQSVEALPPEPVLEYMGDARFPLYGIDWRTRQIIRQSPRPEDIGQIPDYITVAHAVLVPFYYRPDRYVDHTIYLSAHVSIYTPDKRTRLKRVTDGIWDGDPLKSSKRIQTGHTLELLSAFVPIATTEAGIISAEYHQEKEQSYMGENIYDAPKLEVHKGTSFLILVELLPKRMSKDPFPIQPFWFSLEFVAGVPAPPKLTFIESPA